MFEFKNKGKLCDPHLWEPRNVVPIGALLHTTDGVNSQSYLQGGILADGRVASADYLIGRDGTTIRLVPEGAMSYHAGATCWAQIRGTDADPNRDLVGIELENFDRKGEIPTTRQHMALAGLLLVLADKYKWSPLYVWTHGGIAVPMGRRTDPRALNLGYVFWLMEFAPELTQFYGDTVI